MDTNILYSLVTKNRTPRIKPGQSIETEIFMTGHGIPDINKLLCQVSSPFILDQNDIGEITSAIAYGENNATGEIRPCAGKHHLTKHKPGPDGVLAILSKGNFLEIPNHESSKENIKGGIGHVMSEYTWEGHPPILLKFNTDKKAPAGDYEVTLTLTYGSHDRLLQASSTSRVHITSWWERNQGRLAMIGVLIALASLVVTALSKIL